MRNHFSTSQHKFVRAEEGQALILTAVVMSVLLLMAGLGVDVGFYRYQKQQMQKAADSGAIAGASALLYGSAVTAAAQNDSAANGFTDGSNGITVTVNHPPASGTHNGDGKYVEVIVAQPQPRFFLGFLSHDPVPVRGRAVASAWADASGCIYVLDNTSTPQSGFTATGTSTVQGTCGIKVNSPSSTAYNDNGGACVTMGDGIGVVGQVGSTQNCSTTPVTGIAPFSDPLEGLTAPTVPTPVNCDYSGTHINGGTTALSPGTYCGGIQIGGTSPIVTFAAGTYILYGGGLQITSSTSTVSGTGVTFYNTGRMTGGGANGYTPIGINGGTITLSAPTTGAMKGILFFQDRNAPTTGNVMNTITGGSGSTFDGTLYFPTEPLTYAGSSSANGYTVIDAWDVKVTGTSFIGTNYTSIGGSLAHAAALVE